MRERFHPFNTARIAATALKNSQLIARPTQTLATTALPIEKDAGLLYPSPNATPLSNVDTSEFPSQLVVVDGTWHQARTMLRDIPALRRLPHFTVAATQSGNYRIRREPSEHTLSTLEAIVVAMRTIEPETLGWAELMDVFTTFVDRQLERRSKHDRWRRNEKRRRRSGNVPTVLTGDLRNVVVVYGEGTSDGRHVEETSKRPLVWVAERLLTGERFIAATKPTTLLTDTHLAHLQLPREFFDNVLTTAGFDNAWQCFTRENDHLVTYHARTLQLLPPKFRTTSPQVCLKSMNAYRQRRYRTLDDLIAGERIETSLSQLPGRAGQRLAQAVALVRHMNNSCSREC